MLTKFTCFSWNSITIQKHDVHLHLNRYLKETSFVTRNHIEWQQTPNGISSIGLIAQAQQLYIIHAYPIRLFPYDQRGHS